jgi:nanoRNase/pAp phosphatase (c-di-AMP/oligoRNAs hydrolase)
VFLELDRANADHVKIATALMHGLHSETVGFIHAERPEYAAAAFLSAYADTELLEQVLCIQKSRGTMETIQAALGRRIIREGLSLAGVEYLRWEARDAIPQAADFLLKEENVNTAIVYGIVIGQDGRESVIGSLRTNSMTLRVDTFLKQALGKDRAGRHYGGGRPRAGGFEIDLDFLAEESADSSERSAKWALVERQVRRKVFEASGSEKGAEDGPAIVE